MPGRTVGPMNLLPAAVLTAALAVGVGGSVVAYDVARGDGPAPTSPQATEQPTTTPDRPRRPRFKPCEKGAKLEKGVCVTDVVRTVRVQAPAPAPAQHELEGRDDDAGPPDVVEDDDADDDDHGTRTRTRSRDTRTHTRTGTQTRTRSRDG